jgi:NAD(P)-dependent dehydrogenase (short-subunit alcohol dehydrogenase family)
MAIRDFRDKNVLITGAGGGIGLATAECFARRGARLFITDINAELLASAKQRIEALGAACHTAQCDVTDAAAVHALAQHIEAGHGALHVLVNNAGIGYIGGLLETGLAHWERIHRINVLGVVNGLQAFLPGMRRAGDARHVVNISSGSGVTPMPNMTAYSASKAAVKALSEALAIELDAEPGNQVHVHVIYPGIINTPIISNMGAHGANITPAMVARLGHYYSTQGCAPSVCGEDIVKAVMSDKFHVYTGPKALLGALVARFFPGFLRRLMVSTSRQSGYLPE